MVPLMSPPGLALPWVWGASAAPLSIRERTRRVQITGFALRTLFPLQPELSRRGVTLWGDTACPGAGRVLPLLTAFQCPGAELGFSRAFSQFPSAHWSLQAHRV